MRTTSRDVRVGEYFLWRGIPYKKVEDVRWGVHVFNLQGQCLWIGCTALVEYDLKKKFPKKTTKSSRA